MKRTIIQRLEVPEPHEQSPRFIRRCILFPILILFGCYSYANWKMIWQFLSDNHGVLAALATIFIAISSLWISLRSLAFASKQREHNELSIMPHLAFTTTYPAVNQDQCHAIYLRNFGTGPARDLNYQFQIDGTKYSDEDSFLEDFQSEFRAALYAAGFDVPTLTQSLTGRYFVPALFPNQSERILWLWSESDVQWPTNDENKKDLIKVFHDLIDRIEIEISYTTPHNRTLSVSTPTT